MSAENRICPFPDDFKIEEIGGIFEQSLGISDIPSKMQDLAASLNNCVYLPSYSANVALVDQIERTEEYIIFVKLSETSYIWILILAISFALARA